MELFQNRIQNTQYSLIYKLSLETIAFYYVFYNIQSNINLINLITMLMLNEFFSTMASKELLFRMQSVETKPQRRVKYMSRSVELFKAIDSSIKC